MLKILLSCLFFFSLNAFPEMPAKPDENSQINAREQINGLPGGEKTGAYLIKTKKKTLKTPSFFAPVKNNLPANCVDALGSNNFTACEAAKKTR